MSVVRDSHGRTFGGGDVGGEHEEAAGQGVMSTMEAVVETGVQQRGSGPRGMTMPGRRR